MARRYEYVFQGEVDGPVSLGELIYLLDVEDIKPETMVREVGGRWIRADELIRLHESPRSRDAARVEVPKPAVSARRPNHKTSAKSVRLTPIGKLFVLCIAVFLAPLGLLAAALFNIDLFDELDDEPVRGPKALSSIKHPFLYGFLIVAAMSLLLPLYGATSSGTRGFLVGMLVWVFLVLVMAGVFWILAVGERQKPE